jgi:hypothetical protein
MPIPVPEAWKRAINLAIDPVRIVSGVDEDTFAWVDLQAKRAYRDGHATLIVETGRLGLVHHSRPLDKSDLVAVHECLRAVVAEEHAYRRDRIESEKDKGEDIVLKSERSLAPRVDLIAANRAHAVALRSEGAGLGLGPLSALGSRCRAELEAMACAFDASADALEHAREAATREPTAASMEATAQPRPDRSRLLSMRHWCAELEAMALEAWVANDGDGRWVLHSPLAGAGVIARGSVPAADTPEATLAAAGAAGDEAVRAYCAKNHASGEHDEAEAEWMAEATRYENTIASWRARAERAEADSKESLDLMAAEHMTSIAAQARAARLQRLIETATKACASSYARDHGKALLGLLEAYVTPAPSDAQAIPTEEPQTTTDECLAALRERDEARAEVARLRALVAEGAKLADTLNANLQGNDEAGIRDPIAYAVTADFAARAHEAVELDLDLIERTPFFYGNGDHAEAVVRKLVSALRDERLRAKQAEATSTLLAEGVDAQTIDRALALRDAAVARAEAAERELAEALADEQFALDAFAIRSRQRNEAVRAMHEVKAAHAVHILGVTQYLCANPESPPVGLSEDQATCDGCLGAMAAHYERLRQRAATRRLATRETSAGTSTAPSDAQSIPTHDHPLGSLDEDERAEPPCAGSPEHVLEPADPLELAMHAENGGLCDHQIERLGDGLLLRLDAEDLKKLRTLLADLPVR